MDRTLRRTVLVSAAALVGISVPAHAQQPFPDGPGKEIVTTTCNGCHPADRVRPGYTPEGWDSVIHMMQNFHTPVDEKDWPVVKAYLVKNFPERQRPEAKIIPGPVEATIKQWPVPTLGSRPHDPLAARDGSIWYTGQLSNKMGRLDPKTGQFKEYALKRAQTAPHGLVEDKDGNIWFTGNFAGLIGKLDPKTGEVTEYKMPDPAAKDPHTLIFDHRGILWFTVQQGNFIGRIDPKSGEVKVVHPPTDKARPYGMAVNSKGQVFIVEFGTNKVATIDDSMTVKEFPLPDPAARPRRIAIDDQDMIWYTDFSRGYLGRLDPATGKVTEWPSPSGPKSEPYGIVFTKGALWYNEANAKPNTTVRFDPKSEKFQSWAIPGGGDIVRNMSVTPDGNPVTANSLVNQVGLVQVK
jgi:virginiamycin B lyase